MNPQTKKWTYFTIPYPLGFYSRGMDGRIDDANAGWKGRALYSNYGTHFVWQIEGGKGTKGKIVKFQLRPESAGSITYLKRRQAILNPDGLPFLR